MSSMEPMRGVAPSALDLDTLDTLELAHYMATPKIDGLRAVVRDGVVLSKTLKPIPAPAVQRAFGHLHGLDGELVIGTPYRQGPEDDVYKRSRGALMRHRDTPLPVMFCVFDRWDRPDEPAADRIASLTHADLRVATPEASLWVIPHRLVGADTGITVSDYFKGTEDHGYEGAMLRRPDGHYKYGKATEREGLLLKLKRFEHGEALIVDFIEGTANHNDAYLDETGRTKRSSAQAGKVPKGVLGSFLVRDLVSGCEFGVSTGKGMTLALRRYVWEQRAQFVGKIVRYKYQRYGTDVAPRIPLYDGFRDIIDLSDQVCQQCATSVSGVV